MATVSGFPASVGWKNYHYKLRRLVPGTDFTVTEVKDRFIDYPLDIWVDDDWIFHGDAGSVIYRIIMKNDIPDKVDTIYRPRIFLDGTSGQSTSGQSVITSGNEWLELASADSITEIDVVSSYSTLLSSRGNNQTIYTIGPGIHIGFTDTGTGTYADNAEYSWKFSRHNALKNSDKIINGTWTNWVKWPEAAGDINYTHNLPSQLRHRSFTLACQFGAGYTGAGTSNLMPGLPKVVSGSTNVGITITLEGSIDNENWVDEVKLIDDWDWSDTATGGPVLYAAFDSNATDGGDYPYLRLKLEFESGGSTYVLHPHQFMKMAITPS